MEEALRVVIRVWGPKAMFTVAHLRAEPYSYDTITVSAAWGILHAIYGKPEGEWEIMWIRVVKPGRRECSTLRRVTTNNRADDDTRTLQTATILCDVEYVICARYILNPHRRHYPAQKYRREISRLMRRGGFAYQPCFGWSPFFAHYELIEDVRQIPDGIPETRDLGISLFNMAPVNIKDDHFEPVYWRPVLENGTIHVPEDLWECYRDRTFLARHRHKPDRYAGKGLVLMPSDDLNDDLGPDNDSRGDFRDLDTADISGLGA